MEKELGTNAKRVDSFKLQVNFLGDEGFVLDQKTSAVIRPKNSRFEVVGASPIDIPGTKGKVEITMKLRDTEGENVAALVTIAGNVKNQGAASASLRIRIVTGLIELPKSQRDKP